MASFISKFLLTTTVTTPTFLSLGLIGVIKDSENYFLVWNDMLTNAKIPTSFEWYSINISFVFMLICFIGIKIFLCQKEKKRKEGKTIKVQSYSNLSQNSADQVMSSIIPWLTIFADSLDFMVLFVCVILQCCFIAVAITLTIIYFVQYGDTVIMKYIPKKTPIFSFLKDVLGIRIKLKSLLR